MSRFLIIECDDSLNHLPGALPPGVFVGTHAFSLDDISSITVTPFNKGSRVVVYQRGNKGHTVCYSPALPGTIISRLP